MMWLYDPEEAATETWVHQLLFLLVFQNGGLERDAFQQQPGTRVWNQEAGGVVDVGVVSASLGSGAGSELTQDQAAAFI